MRNMFQLMEVPTKGKKELIDAITAYNEAVMHYRRVDSACTRNLTTFKMPMQVNGVEVDVWRVAAESQRQNMLQDATMRVGAAGVAMQKLQAGA